MRQSVPSTTPQKRVTLHPLWALFSLVLLILATWIAFQQSPYPRPLLPPGERGLVDLFLYPIEVNAGARLDSAPAKMFAVSASANGEVVCAVGDGGAVLLSKNGRPWVARTAGVQSDLVDVHIAADGRHGWAVGNGGTILSTSDGGEAWILRPSPSSEQLTSVAFDREGVRGIVVGDNGTLLRSADGGATWVQVAAGTDDGLSGIAFLPDMSVGLVVGGSGTVLRTTDAGRTWQPVSTPTRAGLNTVVLDGTGRGWATGAGGTLLATTDGGLNWTESSVGSRTDLLEVQFDPSGRVGMVTGRGGEIYTTADGGDTWQARSSGVSNDLPGLYMIDAERGWAVGRSIISTRDGGATWDTEVSAVPTSLLSVHLTADGKRGWAGGDGVILLTTDGGANWTVSRSPAFRGLSGFSFVDERRGWAIGGVGTIVATDDGGATWTVQESPTPEHLNSIAFAADGQHGWIASDWGVLSTIDGGKKWTLQDTPSLMHRWNDITFMPDGRRGWLVGDEGRVHATSDGGLTWNDQPVPSGKGLNGVHFLPDGLRGWTVGADGVIFHTANGGRAWALQSRPVPVTLYSVFFSDDGTRGWAAGGSGIVLRTVDGGLNWTESTSTVGTTRHALAFDRTGTKGWAAGYPPALLSIQPGQDKWQAHAWPLRYGRYPAPWFWCALLLVAFAWRRALTVTHEGAQAGAAALAASDAPTQDFAKDKLQFAPLAKGISRFLRNESTEAPLTIAISGEWGVGKSSLMHLVCKDLHSHGNRPVWFNAWHHQNDEQFLAGLLSAIQKQALPSSLTPAGWIFRLRLVWIRSRKHFLLAYLVVLLIAATMSYVWMHGWQEWSRFSDSVTGGMQYMLAAVSGDTNALAALRASSADNKLEVGKSVVQIVSFITGLIALRKALTAFGTDPAVLLASTADRFRLKDASAITNFRGRFAEQFLEVTQALPYRLTIVIDDLDRCRAESVLQVMEAVNFVVSSGPCFVLFGMATRRVQAALAQSFEKVASEMAGADGESGSNTALENAQEIRHAYARDYMEKLINLEIPVPVEQGSNLHTMFDNATPPNDGLLATWRPFLRLWPLLLIASAILVGWQFAWHLPAAPPPPAPVQTPIKVAVKTVPKPEARPAPTTESAPATLPTLQLRNGYLPEIQHGDSQGMWLPAVAGPVGILLLFAGSIAVYRLRSTLYQIRDSDSFMQALQIWTPFVQQKRRTPRALKRFGNRIRYLCMLQQAEYLDDTGWDLYRRLLRRRNPAPAAEGTAGNEAIAEHDVVALGALHEVFGAQWREFVQRGFPDNELGKAAQRALSGYCASVSQSWPPSSDQLDWFARSLRGVRVPFS